MPEGSLTFHDVCYEASVRCGRGRKIILDSCRYVTCILCTFNDSMTAACIHVVNIVGLGMLAISIILVVEENRVSNRIFCASCSDFQPKVFIAVHLYTSVITCTKRTHDIGRYKY